MNITINTVILGAQEIIYRNRQTGGTLAMGPVRRKRDASFINLVIRENFQAKVSSDQQNFHIQWNSIGDDFCSDRLTNG